jgi:TolB protein
MTSSRNSLPAAVVAIPVCWILASCAPSSVSTGTVSLPSPTVSRTATCTGILCTPEAAETEECTPCANPGTPVPFAGDASPTATPRPEQQFTPPSLLSHQGMLVLAQRNSGYSHIWLWPMGYPDPIQLTSGDVDDRDPAIRPDGGAIVFSSQRNGNWDLHLMDLSTGEIQPFTESATFEAHPAWSPDSRQLVYERYTNGHLRLAIRRVEDQSLMWSGPDGMDAFEPHWSPLARSISFTGRKDGHTDIYLLNLDTQQILNLTNTPDIDERYAVFSPDGGTLAYALRENGYSWIYRISVVDPDGEPVLVGQGDRPEWSPDGRWLVGVFQPNPLQSYLLFSLAEGQVLSPAALWMAGKIERLAWSSAALPDPLPEWLQTRMENDPTQAATLYPAGTPLSAELVSVNVNAPDPRMSSAVVERFQTLREKVKETAGWDFLATLDSAVIGLDTPMPPKELLSWLRTGRAFAVSRGAVSKGWLVVVPDPLGHVVYWRLYVRTALQDGTQGEPLRDLPWDFDSRMSGTPTVRDNGGRFYDQIPTGFFIDFSQLAAEFGFQRIPSDSDWRTYYFGIHFWEYVCTDGLDWLEAMSEIYSPYAFLTPTPSETS